MKQKKNARILALLFAGACAALPAHAQQSERESLETLRQTTLNLIDVLVSQGVMNREQANALVKAAEQKAAATVAEQQKNATASGAVAGAAAGSAGAQILTTGEKGRVRVSYIPDSVKNEIREQVRQEVIAQAKTERWGEPNVLPEWIDRIQWEGDVRLRYQDDRPARGNAPAADYVAVNTPLAGTRPTTRMADFGNYETGGGGLPVATGNPDAERDRLRVRARLGMNARVSEEVMAGFRLATGSGLDRVSTNQTMGNNFNKYSVYLDRAYIKYEPDAVDWLSVSGGRIPNPFFSTDLVFDENLNFEGFAATFAKRLSNERFKPFLTVGTFPLRAEDPPAADNRWMNAAQAGFELDVSSRSRLKIGAAVYDYKNVEGRVESNDAFLTGANYGQYEYGVGFRQKGNTLFRTNAALDCTTGNQCYENIWGLASKFRPVALTAVWDMAHYDPIHVVLAADYVKNFAFDKEEILRRTGLTSAELPDGKDSGTLLKVMVGYPKITRAHEWNATVGYRYLGSDAVLDAFTVADFGLGGTNTKGYWFDLRYGIARNTWMGLRWLSSDSIDSTLPGGGLISGQDKTKYSVDVLQVDLTASF